MAFNARLQKQIIIALVYFLILLIIGFSVYYVYFGKRPSCYDGVKNQKEEEIDCGGPCVSCEVKTLKNFEVLWIKAFPIKNNVYDLAAQIKNPNSTFGAKEFSYEFKLYDANNTVIVSKKSKDYVLPNKTKYIIEPNISAPSSVAKISFEVSGLDWQALAGYDKYPLYVKNKNFIPSDNISNFGEVKGTVKNDSPFDFDTVDVGIALYDNNNNPIGVNKTQMKTLISGEERDFDALWFSRIMGNAASVDASAETNMYLNDNFMKRYGTAEKFKEF